MRMNEQCYKIYIQLVNDIIKITFWIRKLKLFQLLIVKQIRIICQKQSFILLIPQNINYSFQSTLNTTQINLRSTGMSQQKQKHKLTPVDVSNQLNFNVGNEHIHLKKVKSHNIPSGNKKNSFLGKIQQGLLSPFSTNENVYYSLVEKQSDSGISFNTRLFFLKDQDQFGYMSKTDFSFDIGKAKQTVPLRCLRKIIPKGRLMTLIYDIKLPNQKQADKQVEKKWVLRMKDKKMTDSWTDIINYQVAQIPSRKTTVQKQDNQHQNQNQLARSHQLTHQLQQNESYIKINIKPNQQPIADQRPQLEYSNIIEEQFQTDNKSSFKNKVVSSLQISPKLLNATSQQSPFKKQSRIGQFQLENVSARTHQKEKDSVYNSMSQKHSQKKLSYLGQEDKALYQSELFAQKTHLEQIQDNFRKSNKDIKQKLFFPSFLNYFRPYLAQDHPFSEIDKIDKKFDQFVSYCQITSKRFIDNEVSLNQFRLSNKFIHLKQSLSRQKYTKQIYRTYEHIFGRDMTNRMQSQAIQFVFENIVYIQLQDIQIVIPLTELKTLPNGPSETSRQSNNSSCTNRICQNSLLTQFQNKQRNLQFVYRQILKDGVLGREFFVPMSCQVEYQGFKLFFTVKVDENMLKYTYPYCDSGKFKQPLGQNRLTRDNQPLQSRVTLQHLHQRLAQSLCVKPQVLEDQQFFRIRSLKRKINQSSYASSLLNRDNCKYFVTFSDILPHVGSNEVLDCNIFVNLHNAAKMNITKKEGQHSQRFGLGTTKAQTESASISPAFEMIKSNTKKKQTTNPKHYMHAGSAKQNEPFIRLCKQHDQQRIKQISQQLDRFQTTIIHPFELSQVVERYHLSRSNLGRVYQAISVKNSYLRSIVKSQIAANCSTMIISKKLQQIILSEQFAEKQSKMSKNQMISKNITTLLNLILGKLQVQQTQLIWKVLTLHSQVLYGCSICQQQIHKGYFILALVSKLNVSINPNCKSTDEIFKVDRFITAVKFQISKSIPPNISSCFLRQIEQTAPKDLIKNNEEYFDRLLINLTLQQNPIPLFIKRSNSVYNKLLLILTHRISPNQIKYNHLNLYQTRSLNFTQTQAPFSLIDYEKSADTLNALLKQKQLSCKRLLSQDNFYVYYKRKLSQMQHRLRENPALDNVQSQVQSMVKQVKVFYEYHPLLSEMFEFYSSYLSQKQEFHKSLEYCKKSISNIISVCEGNSNHFRLFKCFYKISVVHQKMRKFQDALSHAKRARHCLQVNRQEHSVNYAFILLKIAKLMILTNSKVQQVLSSLLLAKKILQKEEILLQNVQLLVQVYEVEQKFLNSHQQINIYATKLAQYQNPQALLEHYFSVFEHALSRQDKIMKESNSKQSNQMISIQTFKRFLKMILPHYCCSMSQRSGEMFMLYLCEVTQSIAKKGGVDFNKIKNNKNNNQEQQQLKSYPSNVCKNKKKITADSYNNTLKAPLIQTYNFLQAFQYVKQQVLKGKLFVQLIQYVEKTQQILNLIREEIRFSKLNSTSKPQSRSSSRVYLMSSKQYTDSQSLINQQFMNNNDINEGHSMEFQNLLEVSNQHGGEGNNFNFNANKQSKHSSKERKFDSLMKALVVLLGDGFMMHVFQG